MTPRPQARFSFRFPVALVALVALLGVWPCDVRADGGCKPYLAQCATDISCCTRHCVKPTVKEVLSKGVDRLPGGRFGVSDGIRV
jgi:hypothetical protein